jgi:hypothetical protein
MSRKRPDQDFASTLALATTHETLVNDLGTQRLPEIVPFLNPGW